MKPWPAVGRKARSPAVANPPVLEVRLPPRVATAGAVPVGQTFTVPDVAAAGEGGAPAVADSATRPSAEGGATGGAVGEGSSLFCRRTRRGRPIRYRTAA